MTPVDQTRFGEHHGNCFAACLASILDMAIEDVPEMSCDEQFEIMLAWLWERGLTAVELNFRPRAQFPHVFSGFGLKGTGLAIASGKSPRGNFDHAVVVAVDHNIQQVQFIHDPHPSRDFLRDLEALCFIQPGRLKHQLARQPLANEPEEKA